MLPEPSTDLENRIHALRQPLGVLALRIALLESEPLSPTGKEQLSAMQAEMRRATEILDGIAAALAREKSGH
jgi:hypothetical protein